MTCLLWLKDSTGAIERTPGAIEWLRWGVSVGADYPTHKFWMMPLSIAPMEKAIDKNWEKKNNSHFFTDLLEKIWDSNNQKTLKNRKYSLWPIKLILKILAIATVLNLVIIPRVNCKNLGRSKNQLWVIFDHPTWISIHVTLTEVVNVVENFHPPEIIYVFRDLNMSFTFSMLIISYLAFFKYFSFQFFK
jgi:hypothetical protein